MNSQETMAEAAVVSQEEWREMLAKLPDPFRRVMNILHVLNNKPLDMAKFPGLHHSSINGGNAILHEYGFPFQLTGEAIGLYLIRVPVPKKA